MRGTDVTAILLTHCRYCGAPLTGQQRLYCSDHCRKRHHKSPATAMHILHTLSVALPKDPPPWQPIAACRGVDPDLFFPERGGSTVEAKAVCASCPVREECLNYAIENGEHTGIWGGTSERERRSLRRSRRTYREAV